MASEAARIAGTSFRKPRNSRESPSSAALRLPGGLLGPGAHDHEAGVPGRFAGEDPPGFEEGVEPLATVAEGTDERDDRAVLGPAERGAGGASVGLGDGAEAGRVDPVIDDLNGARGGSEEVR